MKDVAVEDLAHLATRSPEENEGTRFNYWGGTNGGKPVDGRYHLARNILAIWHESDALTRGKLLLLLGLNNTEDRQQVFGEKLSGDLLASVKTLSAEDRTKLIEFAQWCATDAVGKMDDYTYTKSQAKWLELITTQMKAI